MFQSKYTPKKLVDQIFSALNLITESSITENGQEASISEFMNDFVPIVKKTMPIIDDPEEFVGSIVSSPNFSPLTSVLLDNGFLTVRINRKVNQNWLYPEFIEMLALNSKKYRAIYKDKREHDIYKRMAGVATCIPVCEDRIQSDLHVKW